MKKNGPYREHTGFCHKVENGIVRKIYLSKNQLLIWEGGGTKYHPS
jgi:hypothetical protein